MIIRRTLAIGGLAAMFVSVAITPALADPLADYLEDAGDAIYSGKRMVGTSWDGIESVDVIDVQHLGGMASVVSALGDVVAGDGRMYIGGPEDAAISFVLQSRPDLGARYTIAYGEPTEHLGRPASIVEIMETETLRMRMIVDDSTSAPVATEVYDANGDIFRYSSMVEFFVSVDPALAGTDGREYRMVLPVEEVDLPTDLAGYRLADVYAGPSDGYQAFYTDGLFSFSVFTTGGRADWSATTDHGQTYVTGDRAYLRVVNPTSVSVLWNGSGLALALVGDLPPDHLDQILAELPIPETGNWFERAWRGIFG